MPKLVYVYGDDSRMLDTLLSSLRGNGYSVEYTSVSDEMGKNRIMADIALICTPVSPSDKVRIGELTVDVENMEVTHNGEMLHFTPTEFAMPFLSAEKFIPRGAENGAASCGMGL